MTFSQKPSHWGFWLASTFLFLNSSVLFAKTWVVPNTPNMEYDAQEALILAQPGDTVELPAGRFQMRGELTISTPHLTLKGQGMDKTILIYGENAAGAQAVYGAADHLTVSDLGIVDQPGDGIKIIGANGATIRRVKVEWTKQGDITNGAYGLYPVQCNNVLVEDNVVIGASDAGVYVGQSKNIVVRNNRVEYNVAGVEIENSQYADVYDNYVTNNTGGVLVFNLPNLLVQGGAGTRVFNNTIFKNNFKNFAPPGNSVSTVPQGTGILILGNDDVEIFGNMIDGHNTTSIAVTNYLITEREIDDPKYDAMPESIYIHDNIMRNVGGNPLKGGNQLGIVAAALSIPHKIPHIVYDGIGMIDPSTGEANEAKLVGDKRLCISNNDQDGGENSYFGNLNLWTKQWWSPIPGKMSRDMAPHDCALPRLAQITLDPVPAPPVYVPTHTEEEIAQLCSNTSSGIRWDTLAVDCEDLSAYNLFKDPSNALSGPNENGQPYDLTTPLFSDYAAKDRTLFIPPGKQAVYQASTALELPIGTVIAKTFYFPAKVADPKSLKMVVETRLLVHRESGWKGLVYLWENGKATLKRGGAEVKTGWLNAQGNLKSNQYRVPNLAQCVGCHEGGAPIGVKAGYLNRDGHGQFAGENQLTRLVNAGQLIGLPDSNVPRYAAWDDPKSGTIGERARAYLDINCAHCHSVTGKGSTSGMFLNISHPEDINFGICKPPIAAGRGAGGTLFDIFPGAPEKSILVDRMNSAKAAIKMPELAKGLVHAEGVDLISQWIKQMPGTCKE